MATAFSSSLSKSLMDSLDEAAELAGRKTVAPKPLARKKTELVAGQTYLSKMFTFEGDLPFDMPINVFSVGDWDEAVRPFVPEVDPNYVWDPDLLFAIADAIQNNEPLLIHGPKGSGKSSAVEQYCATVKLPFIRVNGRPDQESSAFFGGNTFIPEEGVQFIEGPVAETARYGGVFCNDEISKNDAGINAALMRVMEQGGKVYLSDKTGASSEKEITPHPWFRIVATDNTELQGDTTGKYVSTNVQDEALISRFLATFRLGYLSTKHELALISRKFPDVPRQIAEQMLLVAKQVRDAYDTNNISYTMSPRDILSWCAKTVRYGDVQRAFRASFLNKLTQTDALVVKEFYRSAFDVQL